MDSTPGESLIRLLDDPDLVVFEAVSRKIQQIGAVMIPDLEKAALQTVSPVMHERIEAVIRLLQFEQLKTDLKDFILSPSPRLIDGACLLSRYQFPELTIPVLEGLIKPIRDEIWLEFSETLTAIEKVKIINRFVFGRKRFLLNEAHPDSPGNNFIHRVLESGKANEHSLSLLYAIIAQELELPVYVADMPDYPILCYVDLPLGEKDSVAPNLYHVLFYINPSDTGSLHSRQDITNYLVRQSLQPDQGYYTARSNPEFIRICLKKLSIDYELSGSEKRSSEVLDLIKLWK